MLNIRSPEWIKKIFTIILLYYGGELMRTKQVEAMISSFCRWVQQKGYPLSICRKLPGVLRNVIYNELPKRDESYEIVIRDMAGSEGLNLSFLRNTIWAYPEMERKNLMVGVIAPYWRKGWRDIIRDEGARELVKDFFFFASQYIMRARAIDLLGALSLVYRRSCDFRGSRIEGGDISPYSPLSLKDFREKRISCLLKTKISSREKQTIKFCELINSLDPFVNRTIFNYLRAVELYDHGFLEEAIVALDNIVDIASQFLKSRLKLQGNREDVIQSAWKLSESNKFMIIRLYDLRCFFGAHPSISKWWDFGEIYENEEEAYFVLCKLLITKLVEEENRNRVVEKNPQYWSVWFADNAEMLWDSIWFHRIP